MKADRILHLQQLAMEGLSCTELANFMLDNGISESVIDNFVTNETTHSKNYYIFSMSKLSCQYILQTIHTMIVP